MDRRVHDSYAGAVLPKKNKNKSDAFDPVAGINFDSDAFPIKLDNFGYPPFIRRE
jgi:hypothetical protein